MAQSPFIPDQVYKRSTIHDLYGGTRQGGISPSALHPYIFIFSGKTGTRYGYQDGWDNSDVFSYTGEGQDGDMRFSKGNLALREHLNNGKRVFLFEYQMKGYVKFVSELEFYDVDYFEAPDINGKIRKAIKFFFRRIGKHVLTIPERYKLIMATEEPTEYLNFNQPSVTERLGLVTSRVGQGAYRKRIIHRWEYKCAVTEFDKLDVLIASHIVPWSSATNEERLDVHNGILLSPNYDALFDRHLISFDEQGKILLSDTIQITAYHKIGIKGNERIKNLSEYNKTYLNRHRQVFVS